MARQLDEEEFDLRIKIIRRISKHLLFEPIHEYLHNLLPGSGRSPKCLKGVLLNKWNPECIRFCGSMGKNQTGVGRTGTS